MGKNVIKNEADLCKNDKIMVATISASLLATKKQENYGDDSSFKLCCCVELQMKMLMNASQQVPTKNQLLAASVALYEKQDKHYYSTEETILTKRSKGVLFCFSTFSSS